MESSLTPRTDLPAPILRDRALGRLSIGFLLGQVTTGMDGLTPRDAVMVMAINQANIAPLTRDPSARQRYGALEAAAPDAERRPVSINAIAASLRTPFETARRHVRRLETLGACVVCKDGVVVPEAFLTSPGYVRCVMESHQGLMGFYYRARGEGLLGHLPGSSFPWDGEVPVRAAARLLSDYLLRTSELVMSGLADDVVSMLILCGVLDASLERLVKGPAEAPYEGITMAALARTLQIPDETLRRHAERLIDQGRIARFGRELVVTEEIAASPAMAEFLRQNTINVRRLFTALAERGVIEAWDRLSGTQRVRA